jgi:serine/threonine protein phosphatase PrpC
LKISVGQHSDKGRKPVNQDFYGVLVPKPPLLGSKGVAVALADGIGSSEVSQVAAEFAVMGFLDDYYCTSEAWSVKKSAMRVLTATNAWLHSRTRQSPYRDNIDRGYVCTLSALVIKSTTAHVFHVGDARIYRLQGDSLERLTEDHRVRVSSEQSYLSRAVGFNPQIEIDYQALPVAEGDLFLLATDGVHEHVDEAFLVQALQQGRADLDATARRIADEAFRRGSPDNLTVQIVSVDQLPQPEAEELYPQLAQLPPPPLLEARAVLDGYRIVRELHASHRSHIYLAQELDTGTPVVLKTPSVDQQADPAYLERFLTEEWVARRIDSPHVLKPCTPTRERRHLYVAMEHIEGQTLAQWMIDHPRPALEAVRRIVEQIARGLQAFHRMEMLHQDLRPENIMIDATGTVKIIDFGSVHVAGLSERAGPGAAEQPILGTVQYTAPEYFLGEAGTPRSDLFSLGVITYQMLSGRLPYGAEVAKARTAAAQRQLRYRPLLDEERELPAWIDGVLRKAVHPDPAKRYEALSEFVHDLRHPNPAFLARTRPPLAQRHPVVFWKSVAAALAILLLVLAMVHSGAF